MQPQMTYQPRAPEGFPDWSFPTLDIEYQADSRSVWMYYSKESPPYYSMQMLQDMADVRESLRALVSSPQAGRYPIDYFVMASSKDRVFNLGGDLEMFAHAIETEDRALLAHYAHACVDVVWGLTDALDGAFVSLAVIEGQALGGGLEAALAQDFILADEAAKLGMPEVAFNTFPGMGAMTHLTRRMGAAQAEDLMLTGRVFSGAVMHEHGVVDVLTPEGGARDAARAWMIESQGERYQRRRTMAQTRKNVFPVKWAELMEITDMMDDTSLSVTAHDIRHMKRLSEAQKRMLARG
jgi:DSF synthase